MDNHTYLTTGKNNPGFTLVEILVAIVIFSIGVLAVSQMLLHSMAMNRKALEHSQATMWASNQAETLIGLPYTDAQLAAGNYGPVFNDPENKYQLTWTIADNGGTRSIQITASWDERGVTKTVVVDYVKAQI